MRQGKLSLSLPYISVYTSIENSNDDFYRYIVHLKTGNVLEQ